MKNDISLSVDFIKVFLLAMIFFSSPIIMNGQDDDDAGISVYESKITTLKNGVDKASVINEIEKFLKELDYGIVSADDPIVTDRKEVEVPKDTIRILFWVWDYIDYPIIIKHELALRDKDNGDTMVFIESSAFIEPKDMEEHKRNIKKFGRIYVKKEVLKGIEEILNKY
jgi:hypothetical protein